MIGSNYPGGGILMDPGGEVTSPAGSLPSGVGGHDGGAMFDILHYALTHSLTHASAAAPEPAAR